MSQVENGESSVRRDVRRPAITRGTSQKLLIGKSKIKVDESGIEPETSPMLRERATNYATRPNLLFGSLIIFINYYISS